MKKLLALMLCLCLCFLTFSCNKAEKPTETEPTETEPTETEPTETEPAETEPPEPEPIELNINVVQDNKITFPDKEIEYIKVTWDIGKHENPSSPGVTLYPGDEFIFRRPESISEIVTYFENLSIGEKKSPPYGATELTIRFYFDDNTYLEFGAPWVGRIRVPNGVNDKIPSKNCQHYECDLSNFADICGLKNGW